MFPAYDPQARKFREDQPEGDILTTGLRVVHPNEGSPLRKEMFAESTEFLPLKDFQKWLAEHKLSGS
jgi:hypothetical protein